MKKFLGKTLGILFIAILLVTSLPHQAQAVSALNIVCPLCGPLGTLIGAVGADKAFGFLMLTLSSILQFISDIADWLIKFILQILGPLLGVGKFTTNSLTVTGWTFIQGIANIFFILTLMFIALAITLRLEGFNVQKMLPRLLIAALLLNFSLVIGGVLIDLSRLMMAIIATLITKGGVNNIGNAILERSSLLQAITIATAQATQLKLNVLVGTALGLVFKLLLLFTLISLAIGLLVRYIMLILLLIISPLAFVGWVLPNTAKLTQQWWSTFLRYVLYGPIVLFIIAIALGVGGDNLNLANNIAGGNFFSAIINLIFTSAMLFIAATIGRRLSGAMGAVAFNFASTQGKRVGRFGYGVGTAPARYVGRGIKNQARDAADVGKSALRDYAKGNSLLKRFVPAKRDDKGKLKPGEQSWSSKAADNLFQPQGKKKEQMQAVADLMTRDLGVTNTNIADRSLAAPMLSQGHVISGLGTNDDERFNQVKAIVELGSISQVKSLFKNTSYLRSLNDNQRNELQLAVEGKVNETVLTVPAGRPPGTPAVPTQRAVNTTAKDKAVENLIDAFAKIDEK